MGTTTSSAFRRRPGRLGLAVAASAVLVTGSAIAPAVAGSALHFGGGLSDLAPASPGPFDGASATVNLVEHDGAATVVLGVSGIDRSVAGRTFGAHLHAGPCVPGNGPAAGPHYNHSGTVPPVVDDRQEVWLDFTVTGGGTARAVSHVGWFPTAGERSVVVHERPTAPDGTAGPRVACLPVVW